VAPAPFVDDEGLSRRSGEAAEADEPQVTVSDHERASDRDDEKDAEETKRLLYVALTRARDRLYLAGTITAGKVALQRGSLGKVLPPALPILMAGPDDNGRLVWQGSSAAHVLRACFSGKSPEKAVNA
jgi:hypothetical protein